jgi:hypothetical protein
MLASIIVWAGALKVGNTIGNTLGNSFGPDTVRARFERRSKTRDEIRCRYKRGNAYSPGPASPRYIEYIKALAAAGLAQGMPSIEEAKEMRAKRVKELDAAGFKKDAQGYYLWPETGNIVDGC